MENVNNFLTNRHWRARIELMTYLQVVKMMRSLGFQEHRYYFGTNTEMWTDGQRFINLQIRDGYTKRQMDKILKEGA